MTEQERKIFDRFGYSIYEEKYMEKAVEIAKNIYDCNLTFDEIVKLLHDVPAEYANDIVHVYYELYKIDRLEFSKLENKMFLVYQEEYLKDLGTLDMEKRLNFDTTKNKRLISRYELICIGEFLGIDLRCFIHGYDGKDEVFKSLVDYNFKLAKIKTSNKHFKKFNEIIDDVLDSVINTLHTLQQDKEIKV